jgi:hypothetical protein
MFVIDTVGILLIMSSHLDILLAVFDSADI